MSFSAAASSTIAATTTTTSSASMEVFALATVSSMCTALHTQLLNLDLVVEQDRNKLISHIYDWEQGDEAAQAELASNRVVATIAGQALPFGSVPMQRVTAITGLHEFVRNRVCSMTDYLAARLFVVENGTAGSFTRSLPRECVLPYSVASDEDLVELARRLCSVEDFEEAELKPHSMLTFSCNPFCGQDMRRIYYKRDHIGMGVSSTTHGHESERRSFSVFICVQASQKSMQANVRLSWKHAGVSPAALLPFSAALPALCAVAYGCRIVRQQILKSTGIVTKMQSAAAAWHTAALSITTCPSHPTMRSSFSSISRAFQQRLQLLGGLSNALLRKLGLPVSARSCDDVQTMVACKVASSLARHVFRCFNE
jgi:hypothetical protein